MKFLYPLHLLFLTALSIPIIIHLFSKKEMQTQTFPSLLFLLQKKSPRFYYLHIREILLLLIRLLALTIFILVFSGVLIHSTHFSHNYSKVVVDNSLSVKGRIPLRNGYIRTETKGGMCKIGNAFRDNIPTLFITDLQKVNFIPFLNKKRHFSNVSVKDIGIPPNTGITAVKTGPVITGKEGNIYIKILNKNKKKQQTNIRIYIDKKLVLTDVIHLSEGENKISFPFKPEQGLHYGKVEIDKDKIPFDDKRYFTYYALPPISVAIISDKEPHTIESALMILGLHPYWSTEFTGDASLLIVIKRNINTLKGLRFGKKIIISMPDTLEKSSYSSEAGLLILGKSSVKSKIAAVPEDNFLYPLKNQLKNIYISPSFKIKNYGEIQFEDGTPFFIKRDKNMIVFNISFINNPFIYRPIFIPFLYYTIREIYSPHKEDKVIDDEIVLRTKKRNDFLVITPEGKKLPFQEQKEVNTYRYNFSLTGKQGIYKILKNGKTFDLIAFNPNPLESNTDTLNSEERNFIFAGKNYADISLLFLLFGIILISIETFMERR